MASVTPTRTVLRNFTRFTLIGYVVAAACTGRAALAQVGPIHPRATVELSSRAPELHWEIRAEHPDEILIAAGDSLTVQSEYRAYLKLREATGEAVPPCIPEAA